MDEMCQVCMGRGYVIICWDDICQGSDECIHGDGEMFCDVCDGEGFIFDHDLEYDEPTEDVG